MPQSILELIFKTAKQGSGGKQAATELKELKSGVGELSSGLLGVNLASVGVIGVITGLAAAAKGAVDDTMAYAEQVRDLGRISGTSAEQTSRLIQVSDDLKVDYSTLEQAAKALAKNGIALTTEELAKASDKYLSYSDAGARAEYATKTFGKAGLELTKVLEVGGDALRKMAAEQSGSLILTQKQVDAARKLEVANDNLEDSFMGIKLTVGNAAIPIVTDFLTLITDTLFISDKLANQLQETTDNYEDYSKAVVKSTVEEVKNNAILTILGGIYPQLTTAIEANLIKTNALTEMQYKLKNGLYDVADEIDGRLEADKRWAEYSANKTQVELSNMRLALDNERDAWSDTSGALEAYKSKLGPTNEAIRDLANGAMADLTREFANQQIMATMTGDVLLEFMRKQGLVKEDTYQFLSSLQSITKEFDLNKDGVIDASEAVGEYRDRIAALNGMTATTEVITKYTNIGSPGSPQIAPGPDQIQHGKTWVPATYYIDEWGKKQVDVAGHYNYYAQGGSWTIPPGYNENYPVGPGKFASSGETVTVTPKGKGGGGSPMVGTVIINNGMDQASFERMLMRATRK